MAERLTRRHFLNHGIQAGALVSTGAPMLLTALAPSIAQAAPEWPTKSVRMLCGLAAGGLSDLVARTYCAEMQKKFGQTFFVENKAGAGSILACQEIARAAPDGYNLLYTIGTAIFQNPVLYKKLPYDPTKDFTPLTILVANGMPLCIDPKLPVRNMPEFLAWAKGKPINLGTYAAGSYPHMLAAQLNKRYGLTVEAVHYKGESPMWQDVASGNLHCGMGSYASVLPRLQAGAVRPIGILGRERLTRLPDVPTFAEQGMNDPQFSLSSFHTMLGPAGMDPALRNRISEGLVEVGRSDAVRKIISTSGSDMVAANWQAYDTFVKREGPLVQAALRELNVHLD